jgi:hypothetical protein
MNKPAEPLTATFDPTQFLPPEIGKITNHQTDLPRIAKDAKIVAMIESKLEQLPTKHDLYRRDSRHIDFLPPGSIHLVVTSPPYWTLKITMSAKARWGTSIPRILFHERDKV